MATLCVLKTADEAYKLTGGDGKIDARRRVRAYKWDDTGGWVQLESASSMSLHEALRTVYDRLTRVHEVNPSTIHAYPEMGPATDQADILRQLGVDEHVRDTVLVNLAEVELKPHPNDDQEAEDDAG